MSVNSTNAEPWSFESMVSRGRKAWADVPSAGQWVDELRGEPERSAAPELLSALATDESNHINPLAHEQTR